MACGVIYMYNRRVESIKEFMWSIVSDSVWGSTRELVLLNWLTVGALLVAIAFVHTHGGSELGQAVRVVISTCYRRAERAEERVIWLCDLL